MSDTQESGTGEPVVSSASADNVDEFKIIQRAGNFARDAHFRLRPEIWDIPITKIDYLQHFIAVHRGAPLKSLQTSVFFPFPSHLLQEDPAGNAGLLAYYGNKEALAFFESFFLVLVSGVKFEIEEVKVSIKIPRPREVFFALFGGHALFNRTDHIILRLTSEATGKVFAVDLTGAQYGIYEVAHEWDKYVESFVKDVGPSLPVGTMNQYGHAMAETLGESGLTYRVGMTASVLFRVAMQNRADARGVDMKALVMLSNAEFKRHKQAMLSAAAKAVAEYMSQANFRDAERAALEVNVIAPWYEDRTMREHNVRFTGPNLPAQHDPYMGQEPNMEQEPGMDVLVGVEMEDYNMQEEPDIQDEPDMQEEPGMEQEPGMDVLVGMEVGMEFEEYESV